MKVSLREASDNDLELLLAWGTHPQVTRFLPSRPPALTWELHRAWFKTRQHRMDWLIMVDDGKTRPRAVGEVHIRDLNTPAPEIGLYIGEVDLWGKGIGRQALELAMEWAWAHGVKKLQAVIHPRNRRSLHLFSTIGYQKIGIARRKQWLYEKARSS